MPSNKRLVSGKGTCEIFYLVSELTHILEITRLVLQAKKFRRLSLLESLIYCPTKQWRR